MLKRTYYLFLLISIIILSSCQNNKQKDKHVTLSQSDSIKVNTILDSLRNFKSESTDSISEIADYTENKIKETVPDILFPHYLNEIGLIFYTRSNFRFAEEYFNKAYQIYKNNKQEIEAAQQLSNIGVVKEIYGEYDKATEIYLDALKIFRDNNDEISCKNIYTNLGIIYERIDNNQKALEYYQLAYNIKGSANSEALCLNNIGVVYENINIPDSALFYYKKALEKFKSIKDSNNIATVINNIGVIFMLKNEPDSALKQYNTALQIFKSRKNIAGELQSNIHTAEQYFNQKKYNKLIILLNKNLEKAQKTEFNELLSQITKLLSQAYEAKKDYKNSNKYLKEYYKITNCIIKNDNEQKINHLEIKYKIKDKNNEIKILKLKTSVQKKHITVQFLFIGLLSFFLILGLLIFFQYKKNKTRQTEQMQNEIHEFISQIDDIKKNINKNELDTKEILKNITAKYELTERETEVLLLIGEGYKNAEIAGKMFVSINTVKTHTKNIFLKLDVRNRIGAVRKTKII
ncbi:MAG: tetratricopeptide repeat protein [Bacteroidales bacterium]|nr:tetratricopeptide repeat protein [Bacteroidales bacterium]